MLEVLAVLFCIFVAGFAAGYAVRALLSRRRRYHRIRLPPRVRLDPIKKAE